MNLDRPTILIARRRTVWGEESTQKELKDSEASGVDTPSTIGCISVESNGVVSQLNSRARELFGEGAIAGYHIYHLFESVEVAGLLNSRDGRRVADAITHAAPQTFFEMRCGRSIMCNVLKGARGKKIVEFIDVSAVFSAARCGQRDGLTGLCNRQELAGVLAARMQINPITNAAIHCVNLDRFKTVNDTLGHHVGDALLKLVAQRIATVVHENDVLARLGGDEFAILQYECDRPQDASGLAEQIVEIISRPFLIDGQVVQIGCSIGVAIVRPDAKSAEEVMRNADIALMQAKADGKGIIRHFTDAMHVGLKNKRGMEIDLRRALALQEFSLVYQPQFEIENQALVGFEALVRWNTEARGAVSPAEFIPLAEEIGIIAPLGEWVIRSACNEAAKWSKPLTIAVNLSPLQFRTDNLVSIVMSALANASLDPRRLELEITEGALLDNTDDVLQTLRQLKALGVKVSMDDFGTGYSSLGYLQRFPFDKMKIDQSFIRNLATSVQSQAIVATVIELGRSLGMTTIAEGVETRGQLAALLAIGCDEVQGYLTGRPMKSPQVEELISQTILSNRNTR